MAQRTSISEVPVMNDKIITETAKISKTGKGKVEDIMNFVGEYIKDVILKGTMETVMLPNFGKFMPKKNKLSAMRNKQINMANGKDMIFRAKKGQNIIDRRIIKPDDETI